MRRSGITFSATAYSHGQAPPSRKMRRHDAREIDDAAMLDDCFAHGRREESRYRSSIRRAPKRREPLPKLHAEVSLISSTYTIFQPRCTRTAITFSPRSFGKHGKLLPPPSSARRRGRKSPRDYSRGDDASRKIDIECEPSTFISLVKRAIFRRRERLRESPIPDMRFYHLAP